MPAITACLVAAFHEDPVWGHWAFPDETTRAECLNELFGFWVRANVKHPTVWLAEDCESVAAWLPPGEPDLSPAEQEQFGPLLGRLFGSRAPELEALFDEFDKHHPDEPHWYLSMWGTHPEFSGRGVGTTLINETLAVVDASEIPAYLESSNPANIARYEDLGFARQADFGPADGPVITTMWRTAR